MPRVHFTPNLRRHVATPDGAVTVPGETVAEALDAVFAQHAELRGYVVDEHGRLRTHMVIFVDGKPVLDRVHLTDTVAEQSELYVMQALSGG